jgi:hypothetical protein
MSWRLAHRDWNEFHPEPIITPDLWHDLPVFETRRR